MMRATQYIELITPNEVLFFALALSNARKITANAVPAARVLK